MKDKGRIVKEAVSESGYSITKLAKDMGRSRAWIYTLFNSKNIPFHVIKSIGSTINHDFSNEIEGFEIKLPDVKEGDDTDYWRNKYVHLLEDYNEMLKQLSKKN